MSKMNIKKTLFAIETALRATENCYFASESSLGDAEIEMETAIANERRFVFGFGYQLKTLVDMMYQGELIVDVEPKKLLQANLLDRNSKLRSVITRHPVGTRYPDIVIHGGQGNWNDQCLAIEVKQDIHVKRVIYDLQKLSCYADNDGLRYDHVAFITYGTDHKGQREEVMSIVRRALSTRQLNKAFVRNLILGSASQEDVVVNQPFLKDV